MGWRYLPDGWSSDPRDTPIFDELREALMAKHIDADGDGAPDQADEPLAQTAGEQDHSDPWIYAGEDTDPPGAA